MAKLRNSVPISETVAVNTREANVVIQGVDCHAIGGSFKVHLLKDDQRLASRFFFQAAGAAAAEQYASFDFTLPLDVLANGSFRVEIEGAEAGPKLSFEEAGQPTLSVYLMLESL